MDPPPEEGNFCDDSKLAVKPQIVARYNRHMGYINISDCYSMCRRTFKWTTKLFFHLLDLTVLKSWILLSSCGAKCTHNIASPPVWLEGQVRLQQMLWGWTASITSIGQQKKNNIRCRVCSERGQRNTTIYKCAKCDVGLCVVPCFASYHTKTNF